MTLTNIGPLFGTLLSQLRSLAEATDYVAATWSGGDMPRQNVQAIEQRAHAALQTVSAIRTEFARPDVSSATALAAVSSYNWSGTLGALNTGINAIEAAVEPWQNRVVAEQATIALELFTVTNGGATYKVTRPAVNFSQAVGTALQNSTELATLRTALDNLGIGIAT